MGCQYPCSQTGNLGSLATFMVPGFRQADLDPSEVSDMSMVKAGVRNRWIDERQVTLKILTSSRLAGADMILAYHAREVAKWLR